jgi:hypothetical protein
MKNILPALFFLFTTVICVAFEGKVKVVSPNGQFSISMPIGSYCFTLKDEKNGHTDEYYCGVNVGQAQWTSDSRTVLCKMQKSWHSWCTIFHWNGKEKGWNRYSISCPMPKTDKNADQDMFYDELVSWTISDSKIYFTFILHTNDTEPPFKYTFWVDPNTGALHDVKSVKIGDMEYRKLKSEANRTFGNFEDCALPNKN